MEERCGKKAMRVERMDVEWGVCGVCDARVAVMEWLKVCSVRSEGRLNAV